MASTIVDFDPFASPALLRTAPSTESQQELWTAAKFGNDASLAFNEAISLELVGSFELTSFQRAVRAVVEAHEALHTSFGADGTTLLVEEPTIDVPFEDLEHLVESQRIFRLNEAKRQQVTEPFDLAKAPLFRVRVLKLGKAQHVALISAHHIVCDGWSMAVILKDLSEAYRRCLEGKPPQLGERPRFSDYANSESQVNRTEEYRNAERYWLSQFGGALPILDVPYDRNRPPLKTYASARVDFVLGADLVTRIKALGAKKGASFFVTMLAAFNSFVHRISGAEDIVVGVPSAGQSFTGNNALVGHCVNMLPVRTPLASSVTFDALLGTVRRTLLDAYEHQQLTFGALLKKLVLPRDASRLPIMSISFNVDQAVTGDELSFGTLRAIVTTTPRAFENFDLFINAAEKHGRVVLETQYNSDLFDRTTIERWLASFETLLVGISNMPTTAIGQLEFASADDVRQVATWNASTARDYPKSESLSALLMRFAQTEPQRIALRAVDGDFTYGDLERRSRVIAQMLVERGIGRGTLVGVALERSSRLLVAVLGILRAGGAYVPLDPSFPSDRLAFMAEDANIQLLLSEHKLESSLPPFSCARWFFDDETALPVKEAPLEVVEAAEEDPAYVIYTSGSTGKPKGVIIPRRAVVNFLESMAVEPGLSSRDCLLAVTTLSFDISVLELLLPLWVGASIVLATSTQSTDGVALKQLMMRHGVTVLQATPATWRLLLAADANFGANFKALCGGEALPLSLASELLESGLELWNMYGPTETTVWSTCHRILPDRQKVLVGKPIFNTQVYILDAALKQTPIGIPGELCIAGEGVTLGYLNRPDLTADRFIDNPFGTGKLYRTGDLARYLTDGTIECLGRSDGQIKLRGYRIELGEIETNLARHPAIAQAVLIVREDRPGDQRLVAYVIYNGQPPSVEELRAHLKTTLPDYMIPQHFVEMSAYPLTPNGKVDKKRLPSPVASAISTEESYVPPQGETELLLQGIWQKVLGLPRVGVTDNFFQLGGHSLLAAQVTTQITRSTSNELSMRRLFEAPTIRELAKIINAGKGIDKQATAIPRRTPNASSPLTPMQQRLWFMEEMSPGTAVYNLPACFRFHGVLDQGALNRALDLIAERHTTMRSTIDWRDGVLQQIVADRLTFDLSPIDLSNLEPATRERTLLEMLKAAAAEPFNVRTGPLARAALFILGPRETVLFFMPHHAIWDGWSFDVFLDELDRTYAAFASNTSPHLPPLEVTYGDFAEWYNQWLSGPELERQVAFWQSQLSGELPILDLPTDLPRPPTMTYAGKTKAFEIDLELLNRLSEVAQRAGATLYMVLLAAFDVLLYKLTAQTDIVVGTPIRGRSRPEVERLLGYFVNTLPLRTQIAPDESFQDLLLRVRETCVQAFGNQDVPFELLVQKLAVARDTSRTPIYSAFFTFQDVRNRKSSIGQLSYEQIHVHPPVSPTDLSLWVKQLDNVVVGGLDYSTDLFTDATACQWLDEYQILLRAIVANSERKVSLFDVLTDSEKSKLSELSRAPSDYQRDAFLHQLFEEQVHRTPDAVAATFGRSKLSYSELDQRTNALARTLRERGYGAGTWVGICLERSLDLLIAALAVLKCGAAYVPLDPAFPVERLKFMVEDSGLSVIIVHEKTRKDAPIIDGVGVLDLDEEREKLALANSNPLDPTSVTSATSPAYVIYTSGSTGQPKGVIIPHRAAVNFVTSMAQEPGLSSTDRLLAVTTLSFDIAVLELYVPLSVGARVVIASRSIIADGELLDEAIADNEITVMQATPSTWRLLLAAGFKGTERFKILCGGEAFPRDLALQLLEVADEVWNMYGPTETTVWSLCKRLEKPLERITIGRAIANTSLYVVDAQGQLTPLGSPGELWIGGDGLALGYHNRAQLTSDRFVANPFGSGLVYKTGDLVRVIHGEVEYLRRNDNQIKLRGYRIELGEIESALTDLPNVRQACVIVREDQPSDTRLVGYLVVENGSIVEEAALRQTLRTRLPDYMIPQHFVTLAKLPLTPNGKIDRRALPAPEQSLTVSTRNYTAPKTEQERFLAEIWQEVLKVPQVSTTDNFFDLGGHSLLCLQLTARIEQRTGKALNPRIILLNNLAQVAAILAETVETTKPSVPVTSGVVANSSAPQEAPRTLAQRLMRRFTTR